MVARLNGLPDFAVTCEDMGVCPVADNVPLLEEYLSAINKIQAQFQKIVKLKACKSALKSVKKKVANIGREVDQLVSNGHGYANQYPRLINTCN
ncbi:MAG: hypothetical protein DCC75_03890 [Proteobacteria bacterium]|nr:MAG: hypothetical protein DCC75_03890 [Pseudomonadota bacterium]